MLGALVAPVLRAALAPRARRFRRALDDVAGAQRATLARIVAAAAATRYARSLRLDANAAADAFRARVPVVGYEALAPWIEAQRAGERDGIAPGRVSCYEPTSGSSGALKRIPYNDALLAAFNDAFAVWAHDLLAHGLALRSGRAFMSVSAPVPGAEGFADDRAYLRRPLRALVGRFLVLPRAGVPAAAFRDELAVALLSARDLEVVSVWSPSYLLNALDHVEAHRARLLPRVPPRQRAALARDPIEWSDVWPALRLVSCWTSAAAAAPARALARRLPHARMQGKGLLATEAPVTVPLTEAGGFVPLVDTVFLELEDDAGRARLLHEAEDGREYAVILTQPGGLLRYRLGDRVRVTGRWRDVPLLDFVGRDGVCDLAGEKLGEPFVAAALARVAHAGAFGTLLPVADERGARYRLLTDDPDPALGAALDGELQASFRYREARLLGQLGPVEVCVDPRMRRRVHDALQAAGMREGDVKDRALVTSPATAARQCALRAQRSSA